MSYEKKTVSKSICIVYHTEKQIVTKIHLPHSGFVFTVAKIRKILDLASRNEEIPSKVQTRKLRLLQLLQCCS